MPRILGVDIPENKRLEVSLTYIFGIGRAKAKEIIAKANLDPNMKAKELTFDQIAMLADVIQKHCLVEGDLKREIQQNIQRLVKIGSYRGLRHKKKLPVRGQSTATNARTRKGKKKTIANKKVAAK